MSWKWSDDVINIVYACNKEYIRQTVISMVSVLKHNRKVKFYLVLDSCSDEEKTFVQYYLSKYNSSAEIFDMRQIFPFIDFDKEDRHPETIYVKLFLDQIIEDEKVLYLDSDVIVCDTLEPLFERDMINEVAAGVLMPYSPKVKERTGTTPGEPYICDGVVIFNLKRWKAEKKSELCLQYILENHGCPPMLSEGTLNRIAEGEMGVLEPRYNQMPSMLAYNLGQIRSLFKADYYYDDVAQMVAARENPAIIHFMNELYNRPWCEPCEHPFKEKYLNIENDIFGINFSIKKNLSWHTQVTVFIKKKIPFCFFRWLYQRKNRL